MPFDPVRARANVLLIEEAVKEFFMPDIAADFHDGLDDSLHEVVAPLEARPDFDSLGVATNRDSEEYKAGTELGKILGRAHNIGNLFPVGAYDE